MSPGLCRTQGKPTKNTDSLREQKQRLPQALLLPGPVLRPSPGLTGSPQPVTHRSSRPSQLCPGAAMAPWHGCVPWGPSRYPPGVWMRTQLRYGSPGTPHPPARRNASSHFIDEKTEVLRSSMTHPRAHTKKWYKQDNTYLYLCSVASNKHLWSPCCILRICDTREHIHYPPLIGWGQAEEEGGPPHVMGSSWHSPNPPGHPQGCFLCRLPTLVHRWVVMSTLVQHLF